MVRNTHTLEDALYTFRRTVTDRVRRNVAEEMKTAQNSARYQGAFGYYAMLQNTDHTDCLTLQQIEEIVRVGKQDLLEEKSIFRKGINALSSLFGKNPSSDISDVAQTFVKYHSLEKKMVASLTKTRTALAEARHDYVRNDLQGRIARLEKQQKRIGEDVLSGKTDSLAAFIFQQRGYIPADSTYSVKKVEQQAPRLSVISTTQYIFPREEAHSSYFRRSAVAAASLTTLAAAGCLAYFTFPGSSSEASAHSLSPSSTYAPSYEIRPENPSFSPSLVSTSFDSAVSLLPEPLPKPEPKIYGYAPGASEFLQPSSLERRSVIAAIDSWNGTSTVSLRGLPTTNLHNGIYRVEERKGYVDFLFVENNVVKGTGSYKLG